MTLHDLPTRRKLADADRIKQAVAIKECLQYLLRDALESNLPMTAQMIGVSAEAVLMDLEKLERQHLGPAQA